MYFIVRKEMRFTLLFLASLFSAYSSAGVYKCTDANGDTEYRSNPCAPGRSNIEINVKTGSSTDLDEQENQQDLDQKKQQATLEQKKLVQQKQANLNKEAIDESAKNQFLIKNNPDKFSVYAFPSYAPEKLPDVVKNYEERLAEIERMRREAAEKALATGQCIRVESAELSRKSTKDALVFLIDCSSAKRFYFTEQELTK
jgi:hypothetical protein